MDKETLKKEFERLFTYEVMHTRSIYEGNVDSIFHFFYQHIEEREKLLKAADEVMDILKPENRPKWARMTVKTEYTLENYNTLKEQPVTPQP